MRAILTYHSIDRNASPVSVTPEGFADHVRWLASGRVRVVPLADLPHTDGDAVAITFDDGYKSVAAEVAPRLAEHGLPATVFVVSERAGGTNVWDLAGGVGIPVQQLLDWDELARLTECGMEIGAHTRTHARVGTLSGAALEDEILGSALDVEARIGRRSRSFAYPYGNTSSAAADCVRARFDCGVTTELRPLRAAEDLAMLPRLDAYYFREPGQLERWGTAEFTARLNVRRVARRAREWLGVGMGVGVGVGVT